MDSPVAAGKDKEVAPSSSSKPSPSKDSPFFNYLSSLSPITQTKDSRVGQRLFHVSSPPPVFTSPRENKIIRLQNSEPSTAGFLSLYSHGDEISATVPAISQSTTAESQLLLMPYTRAFDKKLLVEAQDNSPVGSVDKYLADPSEQRENSCSPGLGFQKAIDLPQNSKTVTECAERTILNVDGDGNNQKDREIEVAQLTSSVERASDAPLTAKLFVDPIGSGGNCFVSIDKTLGGSPGKCIVHASEEVNDLRAESSHLSGSVQLQDQYLTNNKSSKVRCENVGNEKRMHVSSSNSHVSYALEIQAVEQHNSDMGPHGEVQPCSKFAQNIGVDDIYNAKVETTGEAGENLMAYDCKEANKFQHGARRRCLQFEAAKSHVMRIERNSSLMEPSNIIPDTSSPATPKASKPLNISSHAEIVHAIGNRQVADPSKRAASRVVLHSSSASQNGNKKVDCPANIRASSSVTTPIPSGIGLHLNSIGKAGGIGTNTQKSNFFFNRGYPLSEDSKGSVLKSSQHLSIGLPFSTYEKEMLVGNDTCKVEDLSEISPCKKRKKSAYNSVDEGCKRCNCKKSKCLKLYCECFAAGVYCAGPCACQNCFNKPEYEDTVLETRQLIESRNPLAFAPRVVHSVVESPQNIGEEGNRTTPASARHKRGCNCKRSSCLKKYCECFQAGVGCSDGCRCDGCKNIFGRKGGMGIMGIEHRNSEAERWNKEYQGKVTVAETTSKMVQLEAGDDSVHLEQCPADSTSPPRPLFRCSNRGIVLPRSWQHSRKHLTSSPESESSAVSSYGKSPRSPMTSSLNVRLLKSSAYSDELGYHMPSKTRDGLADKCDDSLTTTVHQSGRAASGTNYCPKGSQGLHSYGRLISMHDSPVTPIAHFFGAKYVGPDQDSSSNNLEDETPDILKETRSPIKTVKASSPNQKRVSPPHKCLQEIRSSTSPSFKSGRKFILKSVPSFPPLTPYSDSKGTQK